MAKAIIYARVGLRICPQSGEKLELLATISSLPSSLARSRLGSRLPRAMSSRRSTAPAESGLHHGSASARRVNHRSDSSFFERRGARFRREIQRTKIKTLQRMFEDGQVTVRDNEWIDDFDNYETHVYKIED